MMAGTSAISVGTGSAGSGHWPLLVPQLMWILTENFNKRAMPLAHVVPLEVPSHISERTSGIPHTFQLTRTSPS